MVNKLWHEKRLVDGLWHYDGNERLDIYRNCIQEFINLYCPELFNMPEDITPDNLRQFLETILIQYQHYHIKLTHIKNIGESIYVYFHRAYENDFPNTLYPSYPEADRRNLVLTIWDNCLDTTTWFPILPEEVPFLLKCLNVPNDQVIHMEAKLESYFNQFDFEKRCNIEIPKRFKVITKQRQEGLHKGELLPIRPMGIELDMCYKEPELKNKKN